MALFKIFNNIDNPRVNQQTGEPILPDTYNKGYMYFDASTNLFYIDTAGTGGTSGTRVKLNAWGAKTAEQDGNGDKIDTTYLKIADAGDIITANDVMVFKGVINANSGLPADHKQGWTYRIGTAGTYANKVCEVGDIIICVTDGTAANNDHWAVIQNNVDGAVYKGTNAFTDAHVIVADSTAGKVKDSGKTITATAPSSSAADTTIPTSKAVWSAVTAGLGTLNVSSAGGTGKYISAISQTDGKISATVTNTSVSNTWTNGTTAGPKIATTVNGVAGTAVAIPSATASRSGVVTTDAQTFSGSKTFNGDNFEVQANSIRFRNKSNNNDAANTNPYITSLQIGDNRHITLDEYKDDHLAIRGNSILLNTATAFVPYDSTKTYTVGTIVWYNKAYYICKNAITEAEEWNAENWTIMPTSGVMSNSSFLPWKANTYDLGNSSYRWRKLYIGTADNYGSATDPVYWSNGVPTKGDKYAGGTAVTLNGTSAAKSIANFYAPTNVGTSGQLLKSSGSGAPVWFTPSYVTSSGVTSITINTTSPISGGSTAATTSTGTYTISLADGYGDTKNPYASKTAKYVLAAPNASNGAPTFRQLGLSDLSGVNDLSKIEALTGTSGFLKKTAANTWTLDTTSYTTNTGTVTQVTAGTGLNTSADQADSATKGSITTTGTLYLTKSGVTAGSYGPSAAVTGNEGTTMNVPYITVDKYGRVTSISNKTYTAKNTTYTFTAGTSTLAWNSEVTLATVGGLAIKAKLPANPNTNTDTLVKQTVKTDNVNYKLLGTTSASPSSGTAMEATYSANIYANPSTGAVSAVRHTLNIGGTDKAYMAFNSTTNAIDFIFV